MKSKMGKISAILFLLVIIILSLSIINIVQAQNVSNLTNEISFQDNTSPVNHILENLSIVANNDTVSDEIPNVTVHGGGGTSEINETVENVTGNETSQSLNESLIENETQEIPENASQNISFNQTNVTQPVNESLNETIDNETFDENETSLENITNITINETIHVPTIETPVFDISFEYPEKITRGQTITVKGVVTTSSSAKNVVLNWVVPDDFNIIGEQTKSCGDLSPTSSCISEIGIKTDFSTNLGIKEIKIVVDYEE